MQLSVLKALAWESSLAANWINESKSTDDEFDHWNVEGIRAGERGAHLVRTEGFVSKVSVRLEWGAHGTPQSLQRC